MAKRATIISNQFLPKVCSKCGVKQIRYGMCWDDGKCAKCYYNESMTDVKVIVKDGYYDSTNQ